MLTMMMMMNIFIINTIILTHQTNSLIRFVESTEYIVSKRYKPKQENVTKTGNLLQRKLPPIVNLLIDKKNVSTPLE